MTEKELKLLAIAKDVLRLNSDISAKLSGSLMLALMGLNKRREASDIDIVCDFLHEKEEGLPIVPSGFFIVGMAGSRSAVDAIQFENAEGLKIEFMYSEESSEIIEDVKCGSLKHLIDAKKSYAKNDISLESKTKHELDLAFLYENNNLTI